MKKQKYCKCTKDFYYSEDHPMIRKGEVFPYYKSAWVVIDPIGKIDPMQFKENFIEIQEDEYMLLRMRLQVQQRFDL